MFQEYIQDVTNLFCWGLGPNNYRSPFAVLGSLYFYILACWCIYGPLYLGNFMAFRQSIEIALFDCGFYLSVKESCNSLINVLILFSVTLSGCSDSSL